MIGIITDTDEKKVHVTAAFQPFLTAPDGFFSSMMS